MPRTALPPGMYLHRGRPDIFDTLQSVITGVRTAYSTGWSDDGSDLPSGVVIGSCGPAALMDDAARAVGRVSWADWKDVGGVESVEECVFSSSIIVLASRMLNVYRTGYLGFNKLTFPFFLLLVSRCRSTILIALHALLERKKIDVLSSLR
jgi:hypothetical protein